MKRCVVHFGMHKTGSSSIQQSLWRQLDNPEWKYLDLDESMANHGRAVSTTLLEDPHRHLQRTGISQKRLGKKKNWFENKLLEQLDSDADNLLISAEVLCSSAIGIEQLRTFRALINSRIDEISAVGYVRSPKSYMESSFQEKTKRSNPALDFTSNGLYPKYRKQLSKFDDVFGIDNVSLWKFDPTKLTNGCVVQDFCARLGIDFPTNLIKRANDGLSREALAFIYTYHKYGPGFSDGGTAAIRGKGNNLLNSRLATLRGNKMRFSWTAVAPGLDARQEDINWIEQRLGESLDEPRHDQGPAIASENDLLNYQPHDLQWLAEQLGSEYIKSCKPQMTPQEVADWMHALRLKLLNEDESQQTETEKSI